VLVVLSGWGIVGLSLLILAGGLAWAWTSGGQPMPPATPTYTFLAGMLLALDATITLGRAGALLGRFGGKRRPDPPSGAA
jgi:hypothetical protein